MLCSAVLLACLCRGDPAGLKIPMYVNEMLNITYLRCGNYWYSYNVSRWPKFKSSNLNEFEDRTHVDKIYGCLIFKSAAVTWQRLRNDQKCLPDWHALMNMFPGLILGLRPANERRRYKVTPSLIAGHKPRFSPVDDSRLAPSQWETSLQSNAVSHWLAANLDSALFSENI